MLASGIRYSALHATPFAVFDQGYREVLCPPISPDVEDLSTCFQTHRAGRPIAILMLRPVEPCLLLFFLYRIGECIHGHSVRILPVPTLRLEGLGSPCVEPRNVVAEAQGLRGVRCSHLKHWSSS
jgi:hypothetical protein